MRTRLIFGIAWLVGSLAACGGGEAPDAIGSCGDNSDCPAGYSCVMEASGKFCQITGDARTIDSCPAGDAGAAPTTHITVHPDAATNSTAAVFQFTATPPGGTFLCTLDNGAAAPCSSPDNLTVGVGTHTLKVQAVGTGICPPVDKTGDSFTWVVDQTAPTVTNFNCPAPTGNQISIGFGSNEAGATFVCTLDGTSAACTAPAVNYTSLSLGPHTATVVAKDLAGNQSAPSVCMFTVSDVSPNARFANCPASAILVDNISLDIIADVANATYQCSQSANGDFTACTSPFVLSSLADGDYTVFVKGTAGGLTDQVPGSCAFTIDAHPPTVTLIPPSPDEGATTGTAVQFKYTSDGPNATFKCGIDLSAPPTDDCDVSGKTFIDLALGPHAFSIIAIDKSGVSSDVLVRNFIVGPGPGVVVTLVPAQGPVDGVIGPDGDVVGPDGTIEFKVMNGATDVRYDCTTSGPGFDQALPGCTSPVPWTKLAEADYEFDVVATNTTTNETSTVKRTFHVDATPPVLAFVSPTDVTGNPVSLLYSATDLVESVPITGSCVIDGATFKPCNPGTPLIVSLEDGSHDVFITAQDVWGNQTAAPLMRTITVDATGPLITEFDGANTTCPSSTDPDGAGKNFFQFTASEAMSSVTCTIDKKIIGDCRLVSSTVGQLRWRDLSDGNHTVVVVANDLFGNPGPNNGAGFSFTWIVDREPPVITFNSPPDTNDPSGPNGTITFTAADQSPGETRDVQILGCTIDIGVDNTTEQNCTATVVRTDGNAVSGAYELGFGNSATPPGTDLKDENPGSNGSPFHRVTIFAQDACGSVNVVNMGDGTTKQWTVDSTPQNIAYTVTDPDQPSLPSHNLPAAGGNSGITTGGNSTVFFTLTDLHSGDPFNTSVQQLAAGQPHCNTNVPGASCSCGDPSTDPINEVITCGLTYGIAESTPGGPDLNFNATLTVSSVDDVGNISIPPSLSVAWRIDVNPPLIAYQDNSPQVNACSDGTHVVSGAAGTVNFEVSDSPATATLSCTLIDRGVDGSGNTTVSTNNCGTPTGTIGSNFVYAFAFSGLTDNHLYQLAISADDHFNPPSTSSAKLWRVDALGASVTFTGPVPEAVPGTVDVGNTVALGSPAPDLVNGNFTLTVGTTESAGVSFTCTLNGHVEDCSVASGYQIGVNAVEGANEVVVSANDCVGHASSSTLDFFVDETAPTVTVTLPAIVQTDAQGTITVPISASDASAVSSIRALNCSVDEDFTGTAEPSLQCAGVSGLDVFGTTTASTTLTLANLSPGVHYLNVAAQDHYFHDSWTANPVALRFAVVYPEEVDIFTNSTTPVTAGHVTLIGHDYEYPNSDRIDVPPEAEQVLGNAVFMALSHTFQTAKGRPIRVFLWNPFDGAKDVEIQNVEEAICDRVAFRFADFSALDSSIPLRSCDCSSAGLLDNDCVKFEVSDENPETATDLVFQTWVNQDVVVLLDQNDPADRDNGAVTANMFAPEIAIWAETGGVFVDLSGTDIQPGVVGATPPSAQASANYIIVQTFLGASNPDVLSPVFPFDQTQADQEITRNLTHPLSYLGRDGTDLIWNAGYSEVNSTVQFSVSDAVQVLSVYQGNDCKNPQIPCFQRSVVTDIYAPQLKAPTIAPSTLKAAAAPFLNSK